MWTVETFDASKPVYRAVMETMESDIRAGKLQPGERLPTQRELADMLNITPGTANRIYREAERRGLVTAVVGRGTFVTADAGREPSIVDVSQSGATWDLGFTRDLSQVDPDIYAVIRKTLARRRLPELMRYSDSQGLPEHRAAGADWLARFGLKVPPKNVVVTAGAQNALFLICSSLLKAGDRIAADSLTFMGLKAAAHRSGLRLEGVRMDSAGMVPDELDALCNRQRIKALYVSGRVQSPTNSEMPHARRKELRDVILKHGLLLIENDTHGFLSPNPDRNLASMIPDESVYIAGLSKAFAAGLRVAYVAAGARSAKKLAQGIADTMIFVSPVCAEIAAECLRSGLADLTIQKKREMVKSRVAMFRNIFAEHSFESLEESMCVWLKLPPLWKGAALEADAAKRGIRIFSSARFAVGSAPPEEAVRISLTGVASVTALRKALCSLEQLLSGTV